VNPTPRDRIFSLEPRVAAPSNARRIAVCLLVWLVAFGLTTVTGAYIDRATFVFFWMAVLFAAWYAGLVSAIAAALAAVLAVNVQMLREQGSSALGLSELLTLGIFVVASTLVSALAARLSRTANALRRSETQFRTLAEVAPVGIVIASPDFETIYVNPRALEIAGSPAEGLTMARWQSLVHPDDRQAVLDANTPFRLGLADQYTNEYRIMAAGDEIRWVRIMSRWVRGENGHRAGLVMTLDDVSRERQLEGRLQQSQKMEAVGQLAGGIAHDFNNVLTVIMSNLEFLRDEFPPENPLHQDFAHISAAAERARALVKQLLAFGRRSMLQPRHVNLVEALQQADRWFNRVLGDEIECRIEVDATQPLVVRVDPTQLDQVLLNLAVNARDAMLTSRYGTEGHGGVLRFQASRFELTAAEASKWAPLSPGSYVRLDARDTGHGMDAATRARVFEPFFTTKDVGRGSGLGLATVEGIVAQSGGAIRVDSTPGAGTTFTILFPEASSPATLEPAAADEPRSPRPPAHGTVLVVEDERAVRRTTRRMLVRAGYTVHECANGAEAIERWGDRAQELSVVVTDMRMPIMGGAELARALRLRAPNLPFVFVSGFHEAHDALKEGIDVFLEKPFSKEEMLEALDRVVTGGHVTRDT
jgi:PAS domain S-box-containing protein